MKTYKTYSRCVKANGSAFPVHSGTDTLWTSKTALLKMEAVEAEIAYTPKGANESRFDRVFTLVCDHDTWGIRTELSRGFPSEWPHIEIYETLKEAKKALEEITTRYDADSRWIRVTR